MEGQKLSVSQYPQLFSVFGYKHGGEGDEFYLPDPRGYFMRVLDSEGIVDPDGKSRSTGDTQEGGVPNVTGFTYIAGYRNWPAVMTGAFSATVHGTSTALGTDQGVLDLTLDASKVSSVYQNDLTEVRPSNISVRLIIKAYAEAVSELTLEELYPVGSFYISAVDSEICPIEALGCGRWVKIEAGHFLQQAASGESVGKLIEAGLPDIAGMIHASGRFDITSGGIDYNKTAEGAFSLRNQSSTWNFQGGTAGNMKEQLYDLRASIYNSIYGKSNTVQPDALFVNIWRRIPDLDTTKIGELVLVCNIPSDEYLLDLSAYLAAAPGDVVSDIAVSWGDDTDADDYRVTEKRGTDTITHTFATAGEYRITIRGLFEWGLGKELTETSLQAVLTSIEVPTVHSPIKYASSYGFYNCSLLTSVSEKLFDDCLGGDFTYEFYGCRAIKSSLPELWISHPDAAHEKCFNYCNKAANYPAAYEAEWADDPEPPQQIQPGEFFNIVPLEGATDEEAQILQLALFRAQVGGRATWNNDAIEKIVLTHRGKTYNLITGKDNEYEADFKPEGDIDLVYRRFKPDYFDFIAEEDEVELDIILNQFNYEPPQAYYWGGGLPQSAYNTAAVMTTCIGCPLVKAVKNVSHYSWNQSVGYGSNCTTIVKDWPGKTTKLSRSSNNDNNLYKVGTVEGSKGTIVTHQIPTSGRTFAYSTGIIIYNKDTVDYSWDADLPIIRKITARVVKASDERVTA